MAIDILETALQPEHPEEHYSIIPEYGPYLVYAYRETGKETPAGRVLDSIDQSMALIQAGGAFLNSPKTLEFRVLAYLAHGETRQAAEVLQTAISFGWRRYYWAINDPLWTEALQSSRIQSLLEEVLADLNRQRAIVEDADMKEDFRAEFENIKH